MKFIRTDDSFDEEIYFSRLHSTIPAQRKSLPEHLLENKKSNPLQERRKK